VYKYMTREQVSETEIEKVIEAEAPAVEAADAAQEAPAEESAANE
jgi:short-subunit dehydrogenase involved in D-alanine esterification of teichoic acids